MPRLGWLLRTILVVFWGSTLVASVVVGRNGWVREIKPPKLTTRAYACLKIPDTKS